VRQSWWWCGLLVPHRCILLLAVTGTLLWSLNRLRVQSRNTNSDEVEGADARQDAHQPWARAA
jgi:hypothetical protein